MTLTDDMAVTSLWPIKGGVRNVIAYVRNPEKTVERRSELLEALHAIDGVLQYAANELKTERRSYVTCLNCTSEERATDEFMEVKELWNKTGGRLCFHGYQSFKEGEVDADTAHAIGVELAKRLWGERFQVVVATHCNTGNYHNHFVLNSVSFADGLHFDNRPEDYRAMRRVSDELCRERGISVIEHAAGRGKHYAEYQAEKSGAPTVRGMIRADIDRAVAASLTRREFFAYLEKAGYELKLYKKNGEMLEYPALKPQGAKGYFRFHKLGRDYDLDGIFQRIQNNLSRRQPFPEADKEAISQYRNRAPPPQYQKEKPALYRLYLRYCYELHIIERHPASARQVSFFLREDLMKLDRLDAQTRLLAKHGISDAAELVAYKNKLISQVGELTEKRGELRNEARKKGCDPDVLKAQISGLTKQLRTKRKEIALCDGILTRSLQTKEELEMLLAQQEITKEKEEPQHELHKRPSRAGREIEFGGR